MLTRIKKRLLRTKQKDKILEVSKDITPDGCETSKIYEQRKLKQKIVNLIDNKNYDIVLYMLESDDGIDKEVLNDIYVKKLDISSHLRMKIEFLYFNIFTYILNNYDHYQCRHHGNEYKHEYKKILLHLIDNKNLICIFSIGNFSTNIANDTRDGPRKSIYFLVEMFIDLNNHFPEIFEYMLDVRGKCKCEFCQRDNFSKKHKIFDYLLEVRYLRIYQDPLNIKKKIINCYEGKNIQICKFIKYGMEEDAINCFNENKYSFDKSKIKQIFNYATFAHSSNLYMLILKEYPSVV
jgi:hypothetical protein